MCKEHMGVALALKVPIFFVVTKIDICPDHILQHTLTQLNTILRKPGVKKKPFMVRRVPLFSKWPDLIETCFPANIEMAFRQTKGMLFTIVLLFIVPSGAL